MHPGREIYYQTPIPDQSALIIAKEQYRKLPIDVNGPKNQDRSLVDIRDLTYKFEGRTVSLKGANYYYREDNWYERRFPGATDSLLIRASVADVVMKMDYETRAVGLGGIWVQNALRTREEQEAGFAQMCDYIKDTTPGLPDEEIALRAGKYWAVPPPPGQPIDLQSPFPHGTGVVIDYDICDAYGNPIQMGMIFDDVRPTISHADHYEGLLAKKEIITPTDMYILRMRRVKHHTAIKAGAFTNPTEEQHASLDYDQLRAKIEGRTHADFSLIQAA